MSSTCVLLLPPLLLHLPPSPLPHSYSLLSVSPPLYFLLTTLSLLNKLKTKKELDLTFAGARDRLSDVLVEEKITTRVKGVSHSGTPNSNILFPVLTGEGEEVHAPSGQPEGPRCGKELHVQQAHILHF